MSQMKPNHSASTPDKEPVSEYGDISPKLFVVGIEQGRAEGPKCNFEIALPAFLHHLDNHPAQVLCPGFITS